MCYLNKFNLTFILLLISISATYATKIPIPPTEEPCPTEYNCSLEENAVWAVDSQTCHVFRNACHLENENCPRQNRYKEELNVVPKEECQKLCPMICTADYSPVCAEYNGDRKTFGNPCMMSVHVCRTGETYIAQDEGEC